MAFPLIVRGQLVVPDTESSHGYSYPLRVVEDIVEQAQPAVSRRLLFAFFGFHQTLREIQGTVLKIEMTDGLPVAEVGVMITERGLRVRDTLKAGNDLFLAWAVEAERFKPDQTKVESARLVCLAFTTEHSFDVPPVTVLEDDSAR